MKSGPVVIGSLAALAFFSALAIGLAAAQQRKGEGEETAGGLASPETALEWLNASLGIPSSVSTVTRSGRTYQIAIWTLAGKEAVLVTSLSPKTVYAVQRDEKDRSVQKLVEVIPDDTARADVAELAKNF